MKNNRKNEKIAMFKDFKNNEEEIFDAVAEKIISMYFERKKAI